MSKLENPIIVVKVGANDYRPPRDPSGRLKFFGDGASLERRQELSEQIEYIAQSFAPDFEKWPNLPAVAKVTLKSEAVAKSHRPLDLFSSKTCPVIGTLGLGEVLVSTTKRGLTELKRKVLTSTAQKTAANISTIEKIEPYTDAERLLNLGWDEFEEKVQSDQIKLSVFDHHNEAINNEIKTALEQLAAQYEVEVRQLKYGSIDNLFVAQTNNIDAKKAFSSFVGLRTIVPMPHYKPLDFYCQMNLISQADDSLCLPPDVNKEYPIVGVIDSGICPTNTLLQPWIVGRETYVPIGQENYSHGTMVAGLIVNGRSLNHGDQRFPDSQAKIVDVNVFPNDGNVSEEELISIIEEVVPKYPDVKVWNLSLGASNPVANNEFSDFACFLDEMHDQYQCLFVIASGNQNDSNCWPTMSNMAFSQYNRLSSPADSVRGLTVGSIAHRDTPLTMVRSEEVSPFSRIGPGPCFIPKPEVTHYGGNNCSNGSYAQTGVLSLGANNTLCESIGTSFATPIVSSLAANIYEYLSRNNPEQISPERVKALLIHSALMSNQNKVSSETLHHYGFGRPQSLLDSLYCEPNSITLFFNVDVRHGGYEFEKVPFPMASCLLNVDGKFQGEILMTLVYSPLVNRGFASEYCRTNIDVGMGKTEPDEQGNPKFRSLVPAAPDDMSERFESSQIEHGFKWSPVKAYYKKFPRGTDVETWRLKMKVIRRAEEPMPDYAQNATLVLTIRSTDPQLPVYEQMRAAIDNIGWETHAIDQHLRLRQ